MSPDYEELKRLDHTYLWHPFTQMQEWMMEDPCIIAGGEGCTLVDVQGHRYIDGVSSLWCNVHGHRRRELDEAVERQLDSMAHSTFLGLSHVPGIRLAEKLIQLAPPGLHRVFYSDDGATAVESALKIAFQYWQLKGETHRTQFVTLEESYHGDTLGAVSLGYSETFHRFYRPLLFSALRINPPHIFRYFQGMSEPEAMQAALTEAEEKISREKDSLAALIIEPLMQGAAGMWSQPRGYLGSLVDICRRNGILVIVDEVATGFGRTGRMFACEHEQVSPDLLCLAKGLTGGYLPLAATLVREEIFSAFLGEYHEFKAFFHGHTYTGNPLGCAVALASLMLFETDGTLDRMQPRIDYLRARLEKDFKPLTHVGDVRQWGFMVGIQLVADREGLKAYPPESRTAHRVILEARSRGVIVRPLGDVIILMPPLCISDRELKTLLDVVHESIRRVTEG
ncbi:MAG: adenosylmethionine--8-amino-7-oxononanoate transaminase [Deltaproteobacteria bacterium]|nr:adenosylmethionine--8-amino-7-oxononanoate transaminase [Deltaproteobacteria bacterium]